MPVSFHYRSARDWLLTGWGQSMKTINLVFDRFVGVHNGIIVNAEEISKRANERIRDLDSFAIPILLKYYESKGMTQREIQKLYSEKLKGSHHTSF